MNVLQTDFAKTCMGSLFMANANAIKKNCKFKSSVPGKRFSAWTAACG
jgi:hypothetical protein